MIQFKQFVLQKQAEWGRELTIKEISDKTGVSRDTISRLYHHSPKRVDEGTLFALCKFFKVPAGQPIPFLVYDPGQDQDRV